MDGYDVAAAAILYARDEGRVETEGFRLRVFNYQGGLGYELYSKFPSVLGDVYVLEVHGACAKDGTNLRAWTSTLFPGTERGLKDRELAAFRQFAAEVSAVAA